jgi:DNA invertase Pin-like site-specific DNA recombinase
MRERAGTWQRVSTGGQDEANQLPDLVRWCDSHDYEVAARYVLHGKSASKGKQDKALDEVIRDMQDGKITVLVVWQSSRIERRGAYSVFDLARRVKDAGGRIEYVQDEYLNAANEMSDVMLALAATKDKSKSSDISKQVTAKQAALRAAGSVVGRAPWGYVIVRQLDGLKILVPTATGRKFIPLIFQAVVDGKPLRDIAAWLDSEHVPTTTGKRWNENYIGNRLIKNPVYHGKRRNSGALDTEALVEYSVWQEANAKLSSRARPGRGTVTHEKAFLSPVCGNPECDATGAHPSPMYRYAGFYRCAGRGPQRHGCGNAVPLDYLDTVVVDAMLDDERPHSERVFVPGDDRSDVARLRNLAMEAYARGDKARFLELDAQADAADKPVIPPHWESAETGGTAGQHFALLDTEDRRAELAQRWEVVAYKGDAVPLVAITPKVWGTA